MSDEDHKPEPEPEPEPADSPVLPSEPLPPLEPPGDDYDERRAFFENGGLLAVELKGEGVGRGSIDVYTLGQVYTQIDRVQRGLLAEQADLSLSPRGRIPLPENAAPWRAVTPAEGSFVLLFELGEPEQALLTSEGAISSPTIASVQRLVELLGLPPDDLVVLMRQLADRLGADLASLVKILSDKKLRSQWQVRDRSRVLTIEFQGSRERFDALLKEVISDPAKETVTGVLFRVDTNAQKIKLDPEDGGEPITATFEVDDLEDLRRALRRRVEVELTLREFRYAYSREPFSRVRQLLRVVEIFDDAPSNAPRPFDEGT
jgi:hypothetical protein